MTESDEESATRSRALWRSASLLGLVVLAYLAGVFSTFFEAFPYEPLLRPGMEAIRVRSIGARLPWEGGDISPPASEFWVPAPDERTGVVRRDADKMAEGATLYASMGQHAAHLIAPEGERLHSWERTFSEVWPDPPHVENPVGDDLVGWAVTRLFDDGDLLVIFHAETVSPLGYGMVRLDDDSEVVWKFPARTHHDADITPDGGVWTLTQGFRERPEILEERVERTDVLLDSVVRVDASGRKQREIRIEEAIRRSDYRHVLRDWFGNRKEWDLLHTNNVERVGADFAEHHDFASPDDLLLSFRELGAVGVMAPEEPRITWMTRGPWVQQHDPDPLDNGHLLIFDNKGHDESIGISRVLEYDPATGEIVWEYAGTADAPLQTRWGGEQMPLPNGNVLVSSWTQGSLFEVARSGEIVWEFRNPARRTYEGGDYVGVVGIQHLDRIPMDRAERIAAGGD